jgi:NAD(P)H-dependent FMN reductase
MKVLVITQSSEQGINRQIALETEAIAADNQVNRIKTKVLNVTEVTNEDLREYEYQIWVVPEWNSSFPYTFKKLIDESGYPSSLENREILLIGTSETTFGNIVGITHLESILEWIGAFVHPKKVCLPNLGELKNREYILDNRAINTINLFCS